MFRLSVLLLNSMSKLIHNRCTCIKLIIKTPRLHFLQTKTILSLSLFLCFDPLLSVVQLWNYTKTIIPLRLSEYYTLNVWSRGKQLVLFSREPWSGSWGKTKLTSFPRDHALSILLLGIYLDFPLNNHIAKFDVRATTAQLYPGQDTFEFDQGHVTPNQPITVLILLSGSLAI